MKNTTSKDVYVQEHERIEHLAAYMVTIADNLYTHYAMGTPMQRDFRKLLLRVRTTYSACSDRRYVLVAYPPLAPCLADVSMIATHAPLDESIVFTREAWSDQSDEYKERCMRSESGAFGLYDILKDEVAFDMLTEANGIEQGAYEEGDAKALLEEHLRKTLSSIEAMQMRIHREGREELYDLLESLAADHRRILDVFDGVRFMLIADPYMVDQLHAQPLRLGDDAEDSIGFARWLWEKMDPFNKDNYKADGRAFCVYDTETGTVVADILNEVSGETDLDCETDDNGDEEE